MTDENDFFSGEDAIISLRSTGYKNTATAIGELIDNSIQANANEVHIVITTKINEGIRRTERVDQIAVLDNGDGMDEKLLRRSLKLGYGSHKTAKDGMGKFGMGLPQASISQGKRVDVWSWTSEKYSTSKHAFIDLNDKSWMDEHIIKEPDEKQVPDEYVDFIKDFKSGTIVKWSYLDKIDWKKPETVFNRIENLIGRMYRYWLFENKVKIILDIINSDGRKEEPQYFKAVDPLFLNPVAKCGENPPSIPLFALFNNITRKYTIPAENGGTKEVEVKMIFSKAKDEVRLSEDADGKMDYGGKKDYGALAKECVGVSIVREGRELELNKDLDIPNPKDPRHRWWGAEICFNRDLDSLFGVSNSKQSASRLDDLLKKTYDEIMHEFDIDSQDTKDEEKSLSKLKCDSPGDFILVDVVTTVKKRISDMYNEIIQKSKSNAHNSVRYASNDQYTYDKMAGKRSVNPKTKSETDKRTEELLQIGETRIEGVEKALDQDPSMPEEDKELIKHDVENEHRCTFLIAPGDTSSFFGVSRKDTQIVVTFYNNHPMYDRTIKVFDDILLAEETGDEDKTIFRAYDAMKLIFLSWARMEDEDTDPNSKRNYRKIRETWGEILSDCYDDN